LIVPSTLKRGPVHFATRGWNEPTDERLDYRTRAGFHRPSPHASVRAFMHSMDALRRLLQDAFTQRL